MKIDTIVFPTEYKPAQNSCEICGRMFIEKKHLNSHIIEAHSKTIKVYDCPLCEYRSSRLTNLRKHFHSKHGTSRKMNKVLADYEKCPKTSIIKNESEFSALAASIAFTRSYYYLRI